MKKLDMRPVAINFNNIVHAVVTNVIPLSRIPSLLKMMQELWAHFPLLRKCVLCLLTDATLQRNEPRFVNWIA